MIIPFKRKGTRGEEECPICHNPLVLSDTGDMCSICGAEFDIAEKTTNEAGERTVVFLLDRAAGGLL